MKSIAEFLAGLSLLLLPGTWLAFGLPLRRLSFAARLALAGVLSPAALGLEFYLVRWAGFPFATSVWILVVLNLGSIWWLVREWRTPRISWLALMAFIGIYLLLASCVAFPWLVSHNIRIFTGHSWMQTGIVYGFARGELWPEEPELAGVHLAYPWLSHVVLAVVGWAIHWPPTKVYVLMNLLGLLWVCVLFYETCRALGASRFASQIGLLWLAFGTNIAGSVIWEVAAFRGRMIWMPGDIRTTPWIRKFIILEPTALAVDLSVALLVVSLEALQNRQRVWLVLTAILVASIGMIHPLLFPAALGFSAVLLLLLWWQERCEPLPLLQRSTLILFMGLVLATLLVLTYAHFLAQARSAPLLHFSGLGPLLTKSATGLLAMALFLLAILSLPRSQLTERGVMLLLAGSLPSLLLRSLFRVSAGSNEYKFIFCAALCLAPVAALAIDRWVPKFASPALMTLASLLLIVPAIQAIRTQQGMSGHTYFPQVSEGGFFIELNPTEPERGWVEAVRTRTPQNTVVVVHQSDLFLPAVTARPLWVPPEHSRDVPGYWLRNRWNLVEERGYSPGLYDNREAVARCLYECEKEDRLQQAEQQLGSLHRPVAIVFSPGEGLPFQALLERDPRARILYREPSGIVVWLWQP
jgi:hypothetical protein